MPVDWQTGVVVPIFNNGDQRVCWIYQGITLLSFLGKAYARVLTKWLRFKRSNVDSMRLWIKAAEISFLCRVVGLCLGDRVRSSDIYRMFGV